MYITFWSKPCSARAFAVNALSIVCAIEISFAQSSNFCGFAARPAVSAKS